MGLEPGIDARGLSPTDGLLRLSSALIEQPVVDFVADVSLRERLAGWAQITGVQLRGVEVDGNVVRGQLLRSQPDSIPRAPGELSTPEVQERELSVPPREDRTTLLVLRNDFESLMAAMMVANASAAQGMEVEIYFAFWGVNLLRTTRPRRSEAGRAPPLVAFLQRIMRWMMPAGPYRQKMSKMHMGGLGLGMMRYFMRQQDIMDLHELMQSAIEAGVTFRVCTMSMGLMGISKGDLMDLPNLAFGGVTAFTADARRSATSMVF